MEVKGPGVVGDQRPAPEILSGRGDAGCGERLGELGRELEGVPDGNGEPFAGASVNRKVRASICQNMRCVMNMSCQVRVLW